MQKHCGYRIEKVLYLLSTYHIVDAIQSVFVCLWVVEVEEWEGEKV